MKLNKERNITILISSHLLDELAKVVTKYGIINEGKMIEEISAKELREKCKKKIIIELDDPEKAQTIITKIVPEKYVEIVSKPAGLVYAEIM